MLLRVPKDENAKESEITKKTSQQKFPAHSKTVNLMQKHSTQLFKEVNMDNAIRKGKTKIEREVADNITKKANKYDVVDEVSYTVFLNLQFLTLEWEN